MISARCHTNLDDFKRETWPQVFAALPREGDYVMAQKSGQCLKVAYVTHTSDTIEGDEKPRIIVELSQ